jgi:hypothetical protein
MIKYFHLWKHSRYSLKIFSHLELQELIRLQKPPEMFQMNSITTFITGLLFFFFFFFHKPLREAAQEEIMIKFFNYFQGWISLFQVSDNLKPIPLWLYLNGRSLFDYVHNWFYSISFLVWDFWVSSLVHLNGPPWWQILCHLPCPPKHVLLVWPSHLLLCACRLGVHLCTHGTRLAMHRAPKALMWLRTMNVNVVPCQQQEEQRRS